MKHELLIHCFGEWWKAEVEDECYSLLKHNVEVIVSPAVIFHAKIVYDKSTKKILRNASETSSIQIEMEIWMLGSLPTLNLERRAFDRKRRSYNRKKTIERSFNNAVNR